MSVSVVARVSPIKSPEDDRDFRVVRLSNGMRVLLVSDKSATAAAASVTVGAGSVHNPRSVQGLAHYLEHMLFLGTSKFPDENLYSATLASHGGSSNAWTSHELTSYHFDVQPEKLMLMLDIFAQFFVAPLFTESASERELNAVNSEHQKNLQSDAWRVWHLRRFRGHADHPQSWFHTGDFRTLRDEPLAAGVDVRAQLVQFYKQYYSASRMTACVVGRESLDVLEEAVASLFAPVATHDTPVPVHPSQTGVAVVEQCRALPTSDWRQFPIDRTGEMLHCDAVREQRKLTISWLLPSEAHRYQNGNMHFLSNVIGYEGAGSILAILKGQQLANSLSAGPSLSSHAYQLFDISIELTEVGLGEVERVVAIVCQFVRLLRQHGADERLFNELRDLGAMSFRYASKGDPINVASNLSVALQEMRDEDVLIGQHLQREFDAAAIDALVAHMTPESMRITVAADRDDGATEGWDTEPVYGTRFKAAPLSAANIEMFSRDIVFGSVLHMPHANPFVPTDFAQAPLSAWDAERRAAVAPLAPLPVLLHHSARLTLWHLHDSQFCKPKANVLMRIEAPLFNISPRNSMLLTLLLDAVKDNLNERTYDAELANLHFDLNRSSQGVCVSLGGFNDKLPVLADMVVAALTDKSFTTNRFAALKDKVRQTFANVPFRDPYRLAMYWADAFSLSAFFSFDEQLTALAAIELEDLQRFAQTVWTGARATVFAHGNLSASAAAAITSAAVDKLFGESSVPPLPYHVALRTARVVSWPVGTHIHQMVGHDKDNTNSAISNIYQLPGILSARDAAICDILSAILSEDAFTQLRTNEQLGYIVSFSNYRDASDAGFRCLVQSEEPPHLLNWRIERYLQRQAVLKLRGLPQEEFLKFREALAVERSQPDKRLNELTNRLWGEIESQRLQFRRKEDSVAVIQQLTLDDVVAFFVQHVATPQTRRKFSTQIFSRAQWDATMKQPHAGAGPLLSVKLRSQKDLADAQADGLRPDGDVIDTAPFEHNAQRVSADWNLHKARSEFKAVDMGDINGEQFSAPELAKAEIVGNKLV
jgi:insulysin